MSDGVSSRAVEKRDRVDRAGGEKGSVAEAEENGGLGGERGRRGGTSE